MKNNGYINIYKAAAGALLSLCICMPVFFASKINVKAAATYGYGTWTASDGYTSIRYPVMTDMEGNHIYDQILSYGYDHHIEYPILMNYDYTGTANRYLRGFFALDIYIPVSVGNNISLSSINLFQYDFTLNYSDTGYFCISRPSLISTNDGFSFHFVLYGFFGNIFTRDTVDIPIGTLTFDFRINDQVTGQGRYISVSAPSITEQSFSMNATTTPSTNAGNIQIIATAVAQAINNASDIDTVISILQSAVQYDEDIFNELTYIYSTNQNIYTRLGLILDFLQDWQYQTDTEMQDILEELAEVVETNRDLISELPVFDWDQYGTDLSDLYGLWNNVVRPASPNTRDTTLVWNWLGLTWPVYIIGLVLIMGTISYILYGKK